MSSESVGRVDVPDLICEVDGVVDVVVTSLGEGRSSYLFLYFGSSCQSVRGGVLVFVNISDKKWSKTI